MSKPSFYIKENSWVAKFAAKKLRANSVAMVLGKTIHLYGSTKENFINDERWLKHELCHVKQFEKHGYLPFVTKYLWESLKFGYYNNKFEIEARESEDVATK
jgi:hypothetical protein